MVRATGPKSEGHAPPASTDPQLRILFVTNMWPEGRDFRGVFVERQAISLRELGHLVDVEIVAQRRGVTDYVLAAPRVRARTRAGGHDVIHVHFGMTALAARFAGRTPRVLTLYGSDVNTRWKRWLSRLGWGGVAARIYVSKRLAATAADAAAYVVPNGVDFEQFRPGDRAAARADLGIGPDELVVMFGADPARGMKGHDVFASVLDRLDARGLRLKALVLTEPGQSAARLVAKFDAADVLLFTSRRGSEGSPTVIKEAIAMGLPVVSVDVGDVADMLAGVEPSAVVGFPDGPDAAADPRDIVERLADAVDGVLAARRRANGRELRAWLAADRIAERMVHIYRSVAR